MNSRPTQRKIEHNRALYHAGMRVELIRMDDVQAPPAGTHGTVTMVDGMGDLIVAWDNGGGLKLIPGVDEFKVLREEPAPGGDA